MTSSVRKKTKATNIFEKLHHDITNGIFFPGQRLQMDELKRRYEVGYSPIREALSRLVISGLVRREEHCGFTVAPLSVDELNDLYNIRIEIDSLAIDYAMQHGDEHWEANVVAAWHRYKKYLTHQINKEMDPTQWETLHREYRFSLIKACQSPWLLKIREMLQEHAARYRVLCLSKKHLTKKILLELIKSNEALVLALIARDRKQVKRHHKESWNISIQIIKETIEATHNSL
ncbi:MAG: GntR family transcriptional regulator [Gammaproteobacteria bacterium]|nr:GntR family transcriptional regulator [Gammaproteobacteria bacterium]